MNEHQPETVRPRTRTIYFEELDEITSVLVEHVYAPEGAEACHCGKPAHDPGLVGLVLSRVRPDGEEITVDALMEPGDALLLADRLTRAANIALESGEEPADLEREVARYAAVSQDVPGDGTAA